MNPHARPVPQAAGSDPRQAPPSPKQQERGNPGKDGRALNRKQGTAVSHAITPDPSFKPAAQEDDSPLPFVSLWLDADTFVQVPLTPQGREYLHNLADTARFATLKAQVNQ